MLGVFLMALLTLSCGVMDKKITGEGEVTTVTKDLNRAEKIHVAGNFKVILVPGTTASATIKANANLQPYIVVEEKGGKLYLREKKGYSLDADPAIEIRVVSPKIIELDVAGIAEVSSEGKLTGSDKLNINLAGSGKIDLDINTPTLGVNLAGVGNIDLKGETRDAKFSIAGSGDCHAFGLKSENAKVSVAGIGNIDLYAEKNLNISVAGNGKVQYKGNAVVKQSIAGIGSVVKIEE